MREVGLHVLVVADLMYGKLSEDLSKPIAFLLESVTCRLIVL